MTAISTPPMAGGTTRVGAAAPLDLGAAFGGGRSPSLAWLARMRPLLEASVVISIWLLNRFYRGIVHDARIYVGRAVADLDPQGLGREPAFLYDQQTNHSIFSHLLTPLVAAFGPSATTMGVTLAALLIWLGSAAWLASRLTPRRLVAAALICAAVMPAYYGPFEIFSFGEALATPRGFAEAGVLAGLAALLDKRRLVCGALLLTAALFHPAMAAPGFGVMLAVLAQQDRRWWAVVPVGLIGLLTAGVLQIGPLKTLFAAYDPAWLRIMHLRNGFLFLADWPPAAWYAAAVPAVTLIVASLRLKGQLRRLVVAVLMVAAASLLASFVGGDLLGSRLIIQLQVWRALWIVQVLAVLLFPVLAVDLWATRRRDARLALVLLGLSWLELSGTAWDLPVLAAALGSAVAAVKGGRDRVSSTVLITASLGALALILAMIGVGAYFAVAVIAIFAHAGAAPPFHFLLALRLHLPRDVIIAATMTAILSPARIRPRFGAVGLALIAVIGAPLAVVMWDQRTPARKMIDLGQGRAELSRLIGPATDAGLVWVPDDTAPWFLLSRPSWASDLQGSIGAFSRPLSIGWDARAAELVASGLGTIRSRNPWDPAPLPKGLDPEQSRAGALRLCAVPHGPQAVVLSGDLTAKFPPGATARWRAPVSNLMLAPGSSTLKIVPFDYYTIVHCDRISIAFMQGNLTSPP